MIMQTLRQQTADPSFDLHLSEQAGVAVAAAAIAAAAAAAGKQLHTAILGDKRQ